MKNCVQKKMFQGILVIFNGVGVTGTYESKYRSLLKIQMG